MSHSIPDSQAVADIWAAVKNRSLPVKALTKAEYDVLDETQKNADVVYVVQKPGGPTPAPSGPSISIPVGLICIWSGSEVPNGWTLCDGTNGTPDLRGRFVLGESVSHQIGATGGSEDVTLTVAQMPEHEHVENVGKSGVSKKLVTYSGSGGSIAGVYASASDTSIGQIVVKTDRTGSSQPHPNMPPYYVLAYIMYVGGEV